MSCLTSRDIFQISKYFKNTSDFFNIEMVCKKCRENNTNFISNPIPLTPQNLKIFAYIKTFNVYTTYYFKEAISFFSNKKLLKVNYMYPTTYTSFYNNKNKKWIYSNVEFTAQDFATFGLPIPNKVKSLGKMCFSQNLTITELVIPNNIQRIWESCFKGCENLVNITLSNNLTYIGNGCFEDCQKLETIKFTQNVIFLGEKCFKNCFKLKEVILPPFINMLGTETFDGCYSMSNIVIGNSVTSIGSNCFAGCKQLKSIELPQSVYFINDKCFKNCFRLQRVVLPKFLKKLGKEVFENCLKLSNITLPNSVSSMGEYCFKNCDLLKEAVLSSALTAIPSYCYYNCKNLRCVYIPQNVKLLGNVPFKKCPKLRSVFFDGDVIEFGDICECESVYVINDKCKNLAGEFKRKKQKYKVYSQADNETKATIERLRRQTDYNEMLYRTHLTQNEFFEVSKYFKSVQDYINSEFVCKTFRNNNERFNANPIPYDKTSWKVFKRITNVNVYDEMHFNVKFKYYLLNKMVTIWYEVDNATVVNNHNKNWKYKNVKYTKEDRVMYNGTMSEGVHSLGEDCFEQVASICKFVIPSTISRIGNSCFSSCTNLCTIRLSDNLTSIGDYCFCGCKKLETIALSSRTCYIGKGCFKDCSQLNEVVLPKYLPELQNEVFSNCSNLRGIELPQTLQTIGERCFENCRSITEIAFPKNVQNVFQNAFSGCQKLELMYFTTTMTSVEKNSFVMCPNIKNVVFEENDNTISLVFDNVFPTTFWVGKTNKKLLCETKNNVKEISDAPKKVLERVEKYRSLFNYTKEDLIENTQVKNDQHKVDSGLEEQKESDFSIEEQIEEKQNAIAKFSLYIEIPIPLE
ncbi:hypothetical protein EIN_201570 [Entamoeba invadens IP1]|uniref:Leucine rich repeat containing protein BspA family protein n=1 Tax=Entamoeba invadens IP1 TaxID=370355 RepID=A0A0A1U917_ENTIV|nr:hypothetical protein EIN_201570 [Entamoeba invadens IP1]ELP89632.1 hypothetical protein EIN_201570 [Entamoeba invadens IP1]|eukprot:XP_004256403.1 hypothetical protein EIN_201570 [Entamoeba invadens IP1]